jgi:hypothetical protein
VIVRRHPTDPVVVVVASSSAFASAAAAVTVAAVDTASASTVANCKRKSRNEGDFSNEEDTLDY